MSGLFMGGLAQLLNLLDGRPPTLRDLGPNARASQQHFDRKRNNGAERADDGRSHRLFVQCTDEHGQDGAASRRPTDCAEDDCEVKRNRSPMENLQLSRYRPPLGVLGVFKRLRRRVDLVGDARQPGREHVQESRYAGRQKYRRRRHLV